MSYIRPDIDTQHIIDSAMNSKGLGSLGRIENAYRKKRLMQHMSPEQYAKYMRRLEEIRKSTVLTPIDETIVKLGSDVRYIPDGSKFLEKFNSNWVQAKLKQSKSEFTESDILKNVTGIIGDCNLTGTTVEDLSSLKKIGGTLTVDTASKLKSLSGLEKVLGSVMVHAKSETTAKEFLKSIGLNTSIIKGKIIPVIKTYL